MKKTLLSCLLVLAGIFVVFSLIDKSDYRVEKKLWRIEKNFAQIAEDPKIVPDSQFEAVAAQYQALRKTYPQSRLAPLMQFQTAQVYLVKKDYAKARAVLAQMPQLYSQDTAVCASAMFEMGRSYEVEQKVDLALGAYQEIIQKYPETEVGLEMPIYIANYYLRMSRNIEADAALKIAQAYYLKYAVPGVDSGVRFSSLRFLALTYMAQEKWDASIKTFSQILFDYSRSPYLSWRQAGVLTRSINILAINKLKNVQPAILTYQTFIEKNPGHALNKSLKEMIEALKKVNFEAKTATDKKSI